MFVFLRTSTHGLWVSHQFNVQVCKPLQCLFLPVYKVDKCHQVMHINKRIELAQRGMTTDKMYVCIIILLSNYGVLD